MAFICMKRDPLLQHVDDLHLWRDPRMQNPRGNEIFVDAMADMLVVKEFGRCNYVFDVLYCLYPCHLCFRYFGGYAIISQQEAHAWHENWAIFIRNAFPPKVMTTVRDAYRHLIGEKVLAFKDPQAERYISYNDPLGRFLQAQFNALVSA